MNFNTEPLQVKYYPFTQHPRSDSNWSLSVGPDGRIYTAACCESVSGGIVKIVRYDEKTDSLEYLFDMDRVVDDPANSGRATQCKVHYGFAPSMHNNVLYIATHLSAPAFDMPTYSPWRAWHDSARCFRGSALVAYDTRREEILWWDTMLPKEGCRCLAHDEERAVLYSLGYPRDHFFVYDLRTRSLRDIGRLGSVNAQTIFIDARHRAWTTRDDGRLIRYDPERDRLEEAPFRIPCEARYQSGWHVVVYDAVASPEGDCIYFSTWVAQPHLYRFWPLEGEWGRLEDLGPATQPRESDFPMCTFLDHCGGLTFGADGMLYYVASRWYDPIYQPLDVDQRPKRGILWRLNPATLEREPVVELIRPDCMSQYVSRGAADHQGNLFFAHVNGDITPVGMFKVEMPAARRRENAHLPIRMWG